MGNKSANKKIIEITKLEPYNLQEQLDKLETSDLLDKLERLNINELLTRLDHLEHRERQAMREQLLILELIRKIDKPGKLSQDDRKILLESRVKRVERGLRVLKEL
jgi:hypothetical protein